MRIKICSDSTCDLSPALIERFDIAIMPLHVNLGDQAYRDGVDIKPTDLFSYVSATGSCPPPLPSYRRSMRSLTAPMPRHTTPCST